MKCPQCGTEFDANIDICFTCGWDFTQNPADSKPRPSKLAIAALTLGILSIFTFYLPLLAAIILSIIALRKIRKSRGRLTGERIAMAGILVPLLSIPAMLAIGYAVWSKDAKPIPNEFTEADLLQVSPENKDSYELLLKLCNRHCGSDDASAIGFNEEHEKLLSTLYSEIFDGEILAEDIFDRLQEGKQQIGSLWNRTKNAREVIQRLAEYDQVAELVDVNDQTGIEYAGNLINLDKLYCLHLLCVIQEGNIENALDEFLQMDKVIRNLSIFSQIFMTKMACLELINNNLNTAAVLLNQETVSHEQINKIRNHFQPVRDQHVSLKNYIIAQYVYERNFEKTLLSKPGVTVLPFLKVNSKNRYLYSFYQNAISMDEGKEASEYCELSVWPWEKPNWPKMYFGGEKANRQFNNISLYGLYNPAGTLGLRFVHKDLLSEEMCQKKTRIRIKDDLFQYILDQRMNHQGSLKARAYSDEYTVNIEKGLTFSVGPDGQPYTEDDIKLPIDPDVLGLTD